MGNSVPTSAVVAGVLVVIGTSLQGCGEVKGSYINLCGTELERCRVDEKDALGKWDKEGYCYEDLTGTTVRSICVTLPADFAPETSQPDWSKDRAGQPHCVVIGAYSWYINDEHIVKPHCKTIDKDTFSSHYISQWERFKLNAWQGTYREVVTGSVALFDKCLEQCEDHRTLIQQWCCMMTSEKYPREADEKETVQNVWFVGLDAAVQKVAKDRFEQHCQDYQNASACQAHWDWEPR